MPTPTSTRIAVSIESPAPESRPDQNQGQGQDGDKHQQEHGEHKQQPISVQSSNSSSKTSPSTKPITPPHKPLLRLEFRDLSLPGTHAFLNNTPSTALEDAVNAVLSNLYTKHSTHLIPSTRSITLVVRDLEGVAYTTGLELDNAHKEIHLSTRHVMNVPSVLRSDEIRGVLVHETVHCYQYDGQGCAPTGLTEGIADWVRLKAGLGAAHWRRRWAENGWDDGYEKTGYFLEWLEREHGVDVVRRINEALKERYEEKAFWKEVVGEQVSVLWKRYGKWLDKEGSKET